MMLVLNLHRIISIKTLFLLENQLPFGVLELALESWLRMQIKNIEINNWLRATSCRTNWSNLALSSPWPRAKKTLWPTKRFHSGTWSERHHLETYWNWKELTAAGIRFKPSKGGRDISFCSCLFFGPLRLPRLTIDHSTKSTFLNLIAYGMCSDEPDCSELTPYICFLILDPL